MSKYWVQMPTQWIHDGKLKAFELRRGGVLELKVYFALLILKGHHQRHMKAVRESFPASLDQVSAIAHVSRPAAKKGLDLLRRRKRIEGTRSEWRKAGVGHRTKFFRLRGKAKPFFKFPSELFENSRLLKHLRLGNRNTLQALKVYLLLTAFSNNSSGVARIGYEKMGAYGVDRNAIRAGVHLLIEAGLVKVDPSEERGETNVYTLLGVSDVKPSPPSERAKPVPMKAPEPKTLKAKLMEKAKKPIRISAKDVPF